MNLPISVVIPAYNAEPFLKAAIESVLRQSVPPLEVLVVDDGSTDGTASLARSIEGVRYVHQENRGVSAARNRGIAEASGRFIALLDADDAWREDKLAVQMARLRDGAFAYSARTETDAHLRPILLVESDRTVPVLEGLLFYGNVVGTPSSVIAPREALLEAGGFDLKLSMCADWDMWIRLALTLDAVYSPEPLLLYRVHEQSMSFNLSRYESDSDYMMAKAFALDLPDALMARKHEAKSRMSEVLAACYWERGDVRAALRCGARAVREQPMRSLSLAWSVPFRFFRRAVRLER